MYSCARSLKGTRNLRHLHVGEDSVLRRDLGREGEAGILPKVHLLDDFSKLIKASGHEHSCLLQSLVLGYCSFRSLVGTSSGMAKLYLEEKGEQRDWACPFPKREQRLLGNVSTHYRPDAVKHSSRITSFKLQANG